MALTIAKVRLDASDNLAKECKIMYSVYVTLALSMVFFSSEVHSTPSTLNLTIDALSFARSCPMRGYWTSMWGRGFPWVPVEMYGYQLTYFGNLWILGGDGWATNFGKRNWQAKLEGEVGGRRWEAKFGEIGGPRGKPHGFWIAVRTHPSLNKYRGSQLFG